MPCQIDRLMVEVLDGLRHWPYVLDIVERLCTDQQVRDAFLRLEPTLLRDIVAKAAKSADVHSKYTATAAAMLSHPLPKDASLPTEIQTLFVRCFEQATEEPSVHSIKPVYEMLKGTSDMLLSLLSSSVLLRFEEQLFSILKNVKGDNQSLCLYCLAIMKVLSTSSDERMAGFAESYDTQELLASTHITPSRWTADGIQQFFTGSKAQKTMQLIVLRAMWACTTTTGEPLDERIESLKLANEIIVAVPEDVRETWRKANALIARKLEEKVLAPTLEVSLRLESICFLLRLTQGHVYPATALDLLRQTVTKVLGADGSVHVISEDDISYIARFGAFDQNTTTTFLQNAVDFVTSATPQSIFAGRSSLVTLLNGLLHALPEREEIVLGAMLALDVLSCGRKLEIMAKLSRPSHDLQITSINLCDQVVQGSVNKLLHSLCKIFLRAMLLSRQSTYSISQETTSLILDLHATSSYPPKPCSHITTPRPATVSTFAFAESPCTPSTVSSNWRDALQSHLRSRNESEEVNLAMVFAKSCAELEARCESVEKPLQEQKSKTDSLQQQYDEMTESYAQLEADDVDRGIQLNVMEMERDRCLTDLEIAREANDSLARTIAELETNMQQIKVEAEASVSTVRREMEMRELQHATALTKTEEDVEQMREEELELEYNLKQTREQLQSAQIELHDLKSARPALAEELETAKASLENLQAAHDRLRNENSNLSSRRQDLEEQIQAMKQDARSEQEAHNQELAQRERRAEDERGSLRDAMGAKVLELTEQYEAARTELSKKIEDLQQQHQSTIEHHNAKSTKMQDDIEGEQRRIDKLKSKCKQKDEQIAEANAMRSNLMAAMGINGSTSKHAMLPHRPATSFEVPSQSQAIDDQDPSPPTPQSEHDVETQQTGVNASFTSSTDSRSGPTPKRARPRRTIKVASPARPRMSTATATRGTRDSVVNGAGTGIDSATKRQPLIFVSANPVQRKSMHAKTPSEAVENVVDPMDESTFDGSELFTGTQGRHMLDLDENLQNR